ncbi:MAG: ArsR family transcriptional regulator [Pseudomonadota bacterium]
MAVERSQTARRHILELLSEKEMTARQLSQIMGLKEKEIYAHLPHVAKTASALGRKLVVQPFECLECGFVFNERRRFTRPGRCPLCRGGRIEEPGFTVA